jgi:hypothetical protein
MSNEEKTTTENQAENPTNAEPIINDEVKKEASETFDQAKDVIKNINVQEDAKKAQNFFSDMLKNPLGKMQEIAADSANYFTMAIIIVVVWVASALLGSIISFFGGLIRYSLGWSYFRYLNIGTYFEGLFSPIISPIFAVVAMTAIVYLVFQKQISKFTPALVIVAVAYSPLAVRSVLNIVPALISASSRIISPINGFLYVMSIILLFFGVKALSGEDSYEEYFKKFVLIQAIYFAARFVLGFLNISI